MNDPIMVQPALRGGSRRSRNAASWAIALWSILGLVLLGIAGWSVRVLDNFGTPVTVTVDGYTDTLRSVRGNVGALLTDLGVSLRPADVVDPAPDTPLSAGLQVNVRRARPCLIAADGTVREVYSQAATVAALLADAGLHATPYDEVWIDGQQRSSAAAALPPQAAPHAPPRFARVRAWTGYTPATVRVSVRRAMPVTVDDGSVPYTIYTTAGTVGEALLQEQLTLYLGDQVQPSLGSRVHAGMRVLIQRSRAVLVTADGRTLQTRTRGRSVGDALAELGVTVAGSDRVTPDMTETVRDNLSIRLVRVREAVRIERKEIPFESISAPDDNLEIDQQNLVQEGRAGEYRRRFYDLYEDGELKSQTLLDAWVASQPITRVMAYGRKIVSRPLDTTEGTLSYWRRIRMFATAYSKSTAGVSPTSSYFGITRSGLPMRKGLVAVDPTVIPLGTRIYVPGYGIGLAADTGGGIRARKIDLGYDDDNLQGWYRWVDVYILDPPPSRVAVRWVLPNWPPGN